MKKLIYLFIAIFSLSIANAAEPDSMYIHFTGVNGDSIVAHSLTSIDSIVYYAPILEESPSDDFSGTSGTFIDSRDANEYNWIKIGNQTWMAENLAYLPDTVHSTVDFIDGATPAYGVYGYDGSDVASAKDSANYTIYGALYNWYAVMQESASSDNTPSGVQGICPSGWHVPSDAEWKILEIELGVPSDEVDNTWFRGTNQASQLAGNGASWYVEGVLSGYLEENTAFGSSGFNAIAAGYRRGNTMYPNGTYSCLGEEAIFWCSSEGDNTINAYHRLLEYQNSNVYRDVTSKTRGLSVRCIKD